MIKGVSKCLHIRKLRIRDNTGSEVVGVTYFSINFRFM